jgi:hypothetical protein
MSLTGEVLKLYSAGKLTKEATIKALESVPGKTKLAKSDEWGPVATSVASAAIPLLTMAGYKALESGVGNLWGNSFTKRRRDALFQQLMQTHAAMKGKDPERARANLDYVLDTTPHLEKHTLILGDTVANMTAMGGTDPATLKTFTDIEAAKSKTTAEDKQQRRDTVNAVSGALQKAVQLYMAPEPPSDEDVAKDQVSKGLEEFDNKHQALSTLKSDLEEGLKARNIDPNTHPYYREIVHKLNAMDSQFLPKPAPVTPTYADKIVAPIKRQQQNIEELEAAIKSKMQGLDSSIRDDADPDQRAAILQSRFRGAPEVGVPGDEELKALIAAVDKLKMGRR